MARSVACRVAGRVNGLACFLIVVVDLCFNRVREITRWPIPSLG